MLEIIVVTLAIISNPAITTSAGIDLSSAASVVAWTNSVFVQNFQTGRKPDIEQVYAKEVIWFRGCIEWT